MNFITGNYEVSESDGSITIMLSRANQTSGTLTVNYTTYEPTAARSPDDYDATSGTLTLGDGVASASFVVNIHNDSYIENPDEIVGLRLFNPLKYDPSGKSGGIGCVGLTLSPSADAPMTVATSMLTIRDDGDLKWEALATHLEAVYTWDQNMLTFTNNFVVPPTPSPTSAPTSSPTDPTPSPTSNPTTEPTSGPTTSPTPLPTSSPTESPIQQPTEAGSYDGSGSYD